MVAKLQVEEAADRRVRPVDELVLVIGLWADAATAKSVPPKVRFLRVWSLVDGYRPGIDATLCAFSRLCVP